MLPLRSVGDKRNSKDGHGAGGWNPSVNSNAAETGPTRRRHRLMFFEFHRRNPK